MYNIDNVGKIVDQRVGGKGTVKYHSDQEVINDTVEFSMYNIEMSFHEMQWYRSNN